MSIEQKGGIACHTGGESCFYPQLQGDQWVEVEPVIKDPEQIEKAVETDNVEKFVERNRQLKN